jgi:hypothetical protein
VTSVQINVHLQTTTVVQTVTAAPPSILSYAPPTPTFYLPTSLDTRFRRAGTPATQEQIDAACADTGNIVSHPNFAVCNDGTVPPWSVDDFDPAITVGSEKDPTGNGTIAQFKSAVVGRTLTITQSITLCAGQQYELSALNRQANALAKCTAEYRVGDEVLFTITPQEAWL